MNRHHNVPGSRPAIPNPTLLETARQSMRQPAFDMRSAGARAAVLQAITEVCRHKTWYLLAAHVRTNHVHVVLEAEAPPEAALNAFKSYASRALNAGSSGPAPKHMRWARHGSTRYLWTRGQIDGAVHYVLEKQGEPMAVWQAPARSAR